MMVTPTTKSKNIRLTGTLRLILSSLSLLVFAGVGFDLEASSRWKEDIQAIRVEAAKGDSYYQGLLGIYLKYGTPDGIIDLEKSERWSIKAAEDKGAFGLCNLASLEMRKRNYEKGRFLYDEAHLHSNLLRLARANDAVAIFCLGLIEMECPPRNIPKAIRHFQESGRKGFAPAQATLGILKLNGIGTNRDKEMGIKWLHAAARSGSPIGKFHLGMAHSIGDGISFDQTKSMQLIKEAAEQGLGSAQLTLGMKFANGEGVTQDYAQAVDWLRKASNQGIGEATFQLRRCETMLKHKPLPTHPTAKPADPTSKPSEVVKIPPVKPVEPPKPTPAPVSPPASIEEGVKLRLQQARHLLLIERKTSQAKIILAQLAKENITEAQKLLGIAHYRSQDYKEAHTWLHKAAQKNDPHAQRYLGMIFFLGQGVDRDYALASKWLARSAAQGDEEAIRYREILRKFYEE